MRKETSNQFTEGMVCDMNPINTPNTVLTDNLNGTIITYNGNEFSLQNDRGNYELKYCRLKSNYIPVGIKEYGDILYIVSYNPLDKNVEIGSYPSPLMISTPNENNSPDNEIKSIIKSQIIDKNLNEEKYTILTENADSIIFNGENFKLNPGDEYCIQIQENNPVYKYETVEYNILDEESNIHKITDLIQIDENGGDEDFSHIKWTIPGWLMINARLAELSVAGINIRYFYLSNKTINFSFNLRLNVQDEFLIKQGTLNQWCENITSKSELNDIKFRIRIFSKSKVYIEKDCSINDFTSGGGLALAESGWTEWYKDSRIIWKNIAGSIEVDNIEDEITVEMVPILSETLEGGTYQIVYDNLTQNLIFDLKSVDNTDWNIGTELYQFTTSNDAVKIYTNVVGPKITGAIVNLEYEIYNLKEELVTSGTFTDYFGIGENVLYISYDDKFRKENIYIIRYKFTSKNKIYNTVDRFLITSELVNEFTDRALFDRDINFDEWISKYWNRIPDVVLSEDDFTINTINEFDWESEKTDRDNIYLEGKKYNTFHPYPVSGLSETRKIKKGYEYNYTLDKDVRPKELSGDLWLSLNPDIKFQYKDGKTEELLELNKSSINIYKFLETKLTYSEWGSPFEFTNMTISDFSKEKDYSCKITVKMLGRESNRQFSLKLEIKYGDEIKDSYETIIADTNYGEDRGHEVYPTIIKNFLEKNNLAFIRVDMTCIEQDSSEWWNLSNRFMSYGLYIGFTVQEELNMKDFIFGGLENTTRDLSFIAFLGDSEFYINNNSEFSKERPIILLPLTSNKSYAKTYYNKFADNLFYIEGNDTLHPYTRYKLNNTDWIENDSVLEVYQGGEFKNNIYFDINILSKNDKKNLINQIKFTIPYSNIFINGENFNNTNNSILNVPFNLTMRMDTYPYVDSNQNESISSVDIALYNLLINIDKDYNDWIKMFETINRRTELKGVYCTYESDSDVIINNLNTSFNTFGKFYLTGWNIERYEALDTSNIHWTLGRAKEKDINNDRLNKTLGVCYYGQVFKENTLILEDKWPWLRDEI